MAWKEYGEAENREEYLRLLANELVSREAAFHSHASDEEQAECVVTIARDAVARWRTAPE